MQEDRPDEHNKGFIATASQKEDEANIIQV